MLRAVRRELFWEILKLWGKTFGKNQWGRILGEELLEKNFWRRVFGETFLGRLFSEQIGAICDFVCQTGRNAGHFFYRILRAISPWQHLSVLKRCVPKRLRLRSVCVCVLKRGVLRRVF